MIFGLVFVLCGSLPTVNTQGQIPSSDEINTRVSKINEERRIMAKAWSISNMHGLSWDDELAELAAGIECGKHDSYPGPGRLIVINTKKNTTDAEAERNALRALYLDQSPMWRFAEVQMHPVQTMIGCADLYCNISRPQSFGIEHDRFCVMGPHATNAEYHLRKGPAGSGCGSEKNEDGLCVLSSEAEAAPGNGNGNGNGDGNTKLSAEGFTIESKRSELLMGSSAIRHSIQLFLTVVLLIF